MAVIPPVSTRARFPWKECGPVPPTPGGLGARVATVLAACLLAAIAAPGSGEPAEYRTRMRLQMGSLTEITVLQSEYSHEAVSRAFDVIERLDALVSTFRPDSEVSRLGREGALRVSPEFMDLAARSLEWAERSGGAFNPLLGPVIALWHRSAAEQRLPALEELERARRLADGRWVDLDLAASTIRFAEPGMGFDFGAIGKGYAVDRAARSLVRDGFTVALIASGGSSHRLIGLPSERSCWELGIRHPEDPDRSVAILRMGAGGLSTSAQSGQPLEIAGRRYGHILDPRTGLPAEPPDPLWSATVLGPEATGPDALATALIVKGAAEAMAFIESLPGYGALLIVRRADGSLAIILSSGLRRAGELEGLPLIVPTGEPRCLEAGTGAARASARRLHHRPGAAAQRAGQDPAQVPVQAPMHAMKR